MMLHRYTRVARLLGLLAMAWAGMALVLFLGCPTEEPVDDDDVTGDDDDVTDDDDDDTTIEELPCDYGDAWTTVGMAEDAQGDHSGYVMDLKEYQWQWDGEILWMRLTAHEAFDTTDPALMVDMYVTDGVDYYTLTYDNVVPSPGSLQVWSSTNSWGAPLDNPPSLRFCEDEADTIVMAVDPADFGFAGVETFYGYGAANLYGDLGYVDVVPDAEWTEFPLDPSPYLALAAATVDDAAGNGDGVVDAGETLALTVDVENSGYLPTAPNVTGTLSVNAASTAAVTITVDTLTFGGGVAIDAFGSAAGDTGLELTVDAGALPGEIALLDLALTDDDGNAWTVTLPPLAVATIPVATDDNDFDSGFDVASVQYLTDGTDLTLLITSHSTHEADQQVNFFMDTDLDGVADFVVSTLDGDVGDFGGGLYSWDDVNGWEQFASPVAYQYDAGSAFVLYSVALSDIGDPELLAGYAVALDPSGAAADYAPDDISSLLGQAIIPLADIPYILLEGRTLTEQSGNGDTFVDPDEVWRVELEVRNIGAAASAVTSGILSSADADLNINGGDVQFGAVAPGSTAVGATQPMLVLDAAADPLGIFTLQLTVDADGSLFDLSFQILLGFQATDLATDAMEIPEAQTLEGDTTDMANDYNNPSACTGWSADGNDAVYSVFLTTGQQLDLALAYEEGGPDAALYVSDDMAAPDVNCLAGADNNVDHTEEVSYTATEAGLVYIVVDAYAADTGGPFTLVATF